MPCILTRCRAFILPGCNTAPYKRLQRVLPCQCNLYNPCPKTAHTALQWLFLRLCPLNRPQYQTDKSGYNTTCDTLEGIHAPGRTQPIPNTTATQGRCTGQHRPPIIIMYIRRQTMQARRGLDAFHARRLAVWHRVSSQGAPAGTLYPAGQSSDRGAAARRGTIDGCRRISFRAFAR